MIILFRRLLSDLRGATAVEYGLIAAILTAAIVLGFGTLSTELSNTLLSARDAMIAW